MNDQTDSVPQMRQPPHNIEAEQAILGAIMMNNDAFDRVSSFLEPAHFFEPIHGRIYEVMRVLVTSGRAATPISLKNFIDADMDIGGMPFSRYLAKLAAHATTVINTYDYGRTILDLATRRGLIDVAESIAITAFDADENQTAESQIEKAEQQLYLLAEHKRFGQGFQTFQQASVAALDMAAAAFQRDGKLAGISTGLIDLDKRMGGLQKSDLLILAGRPGMGKTALATNIAYRVSKDGLKVGFFSLEMSAEQLATRIIAEQSGIPSHLLRRGDFTEQDFERVTEITKSLSTLPLHIDETGAMTIGQIAARARRLKRQRGLDLLVIDYIQLARTARRQKDDNRVQEVSEITAGLKALAKELNVPVLALSQLSRQVENRENKRPQLSDLRDSGSIEQDADVVMFVYREDYYHQMKKPSESDGDKLAGWMADGERISGKAEIIIGKQRHGPTGTVELAFDGSMTRFSSLAREQVIY